MALLGRVVDALQAYLGDLCFLHNSIYFNHFWHIN